MRKPLLNELTLREKIGQTALGRPQNTNLLDPENYPYGGMWTLGNIEMGVINFADERGEEVTNLPKWLAFMSEYSKKLKVPVLPAMDCTRGIPHYFFETEYILDPVTIGATGSEELAYEGGTLRARLLKCVGSKWAWFHEVDLPSRFEAVMLGRQYSDDPEKLISMMKADLKGVQSQRVAGCAKHFPGSDGLNYRDAHLSISMNTSTYEDWKVGQGKMFQELIDAGVEGVMVSHASFPGYDNTKINGQYLPSTVSHRIITDLLKGEMGFKGVVITDGISMRGLVNLFHGNLNRVYVESIKAGNDMVLGAFDGYFEAIEEAVLSGEIPMSRIDDACQRVLDMKEKLGFFEDDYTYNSDELEQVNADIRDYNHRVAEKALSLICDENHLLPVKREEIKNVAIIYSGHDKEGAGKGVDQMPKLASEFEKRGAKVHWQRRLKSQEEIKALADANDLIVYVGGLYNSIPRGYSGFFNEEQDTFHYVLDSGAEKSIGVGVCSPFMYFDFYSGFPAFINTYNCTDVTLEALVAAIYGEIPFEGGTPFRLIPKDIEANLRKIGELK